MPIGAELLGEVAHFRVWAPRRRSVSVVLGNGEVTPLTGEADGYFSASIPARAGGRYAFRLDEEDRNVPDPASRFQPDGVHGASQIVDPSRFCWNDHAWPGVSVHGQVIYEMHIGCFTPEGTWNAAIERLEHLQRLGVTLLEVMPVNAFAGKRNWGYDGVALFAPTENYGTPDDFRRFVDRAHQLGVGVILDVVYNHLGPDGSYLDHFSDAYFTDKYRNDWGRSLNFDDDRSGPVREFFLANAAYWIREFHLDGLRLDATQAIIDASGVHILQQIGEVARNESNALRPGRGLFLVNENEPQESRLVRPAEKGGYGLDACWNDDFHHTARVALTGRRDAYFTDYAGSIQELISCLKWGFLYQGQFYSWQQKRRGTPAFDIRPDAFVHYLQNHDQIANFGHGERIIRYSSPALVRVLTTLLLVGPQTPMLFMGQEWAASTRFLYFSDHRGELPEMIRKGRARELSQFPSMSTREMAALMPDPSDVRTFEESRLDWRELDDRHHRQALDLHRDLIGLRRNDAVLSRPMARGDYDAAVVDTRGCVIRFFSDAHGDRILLMNLDGERHLAIVPEPLLAPPVDHDWECLFCSEDPRYGGHGCVTPESHNESWRLPGENWRLPGHCAMLLKAVPRTRLEKLKPSASAERDQAEPSKQGST